MKKIICYICTLMAASACYGQLMCKLHPVHDVAVFTLLSDSGKRQPFISLAVKGDTVGARLNSSGLEYSEQYYSGELSAKTKLTKNDLKAPVLKNYIPETEQPAFFTVKKHDGQCRAEYFFTYLRIDDRKYKLEISCKPRHLYLNEKKQDDIPVSLTIKQDKNNNIIVTANYADNGDWQYYYHYKLKDHEKNIDKPLVHDQDSIKTFIKENPKHRITDPNLRKYLDRYKLNDVIVYKLTAL